LHLVKSVATSCVGLALSSLIEDPCIPILPSHPCHCEFPHAPPQQKRRLQELLSEQRAQNKLSKAFDQHIGFQNVRSAWSGPEGTGGGGAHTIIDAAVEANLDQHNFVSTGLTAADFNPHQQGHCMHTWLHRGFCIAATIANSKHQGGVDVAWRVEAKKGQGKPNQDVESFQCHGPNCLSYHYMYGGERQPVIVAYLLPETLEDLHHLQAAFDRFKNRCPPMLMADLNVDLCSPSPDLRTRQVADFLAANGTEDVLPHFHSRRRFRHQKTWCRLKNALRARCTLWGAAPLGHYVGYQKSTVQGNSTKACIIAPKWVQTVLQIICTTLATIVPRLHPFHLSSFFN